MLSRKWICKNWQQSILWQQNHICKKIYSHELFMCIQQTRVLWRSGAHPRYSALYKPPLPPARIPGILSFFAMWENSCTVLDIYICVILFCNSVPKLSEVNQHRKKESANNPRHKFIMHVNYIRATTSQVLRCSELSLRRKAAHVSGVSNGNAAKIFQECERVWKLSPG
jgi:hypothetical protein